MNCTPVIYKRVWTVPASRLVPNRVEAFVSFSVHHLAILLRYRFVSVVAPQPLICMKELFVYYKVKTSDEK